MLFSPSSLDGKVQDISGLACVAYFANKDSADLVSSLSSKYNGEKDLSGIVSELFKYSRNLGEFFELDELDVDEVVVKAFEIWIHKDQFQVPDLDAVIDSVNAIDKRVTPKAIRNEYEKSIFMSCLQTAIISKCMHGSEYVTLSDQINMTAVLSIINLQTDLNSALLKDTYHKLNFLSPSLWMYVLEAGMRKCDLFDGEGSTISWIINNGIHSADEINEYINALGNRTDGDRNEHLNQFSFLWKTNIPIF